MTTQTDLFPDLAQLESGAVLSPDEVYRYRLWRAWGDGPRLTYVMLNPSTADATRDDQTIRRCMFYARREGFDGIDVVNLFAYRTAYPFELATASVDIVGPDNDMHIRAALADGAPVVVAWGASEYAYPNRVERALALIRHPLCLGTTKDGSPRHPSRLPNETRLGPWGPR